MIRQVTIPDLAFHHWLPEYNLPRPRYHQATNPQIWPWVLRSWNLVQLSICFQVTWRKPAKIRWELPSLWSVAGPPQDTDPDPVKVRHYQELKFKVSYLKKPKYGEAAQEESPLNGNLHTTPPSLCSVPDDSIFLLLFNENVKNDKQNWSQLWTKTSAAV